MTEQSGGGGSDLELLKADMGAMAQMLEQYREEVQFLREDLAAAQADAGATAQLREEVDGLRAQLRTVRDEMSFFVKRCAVARRLPPLSSLPPAAPLWPACSAPASLCLLFGPQARAAGRVVLCRGLRAREGQRPGPADLAQSGRLRGELSR